LDNRHAARALGDLGLGSFRTRLDALGTHGVGNLTRPCRVRHFVAGPRRGAMLRCAAMYVPATNEEKDPERLLALLGRHPFATLVTPAPEGLRVSHIPMLAHRRAGDLVLSGHLARANDHWRVLGGDAPTTAIFHGPHAYVSPTWYATSPSVPTWNYAVVHVTGPARLVEDPAAMLEHVGALSARFETGPRPFSPNALPDDLRANLLRAIVGFELRAERVEGKLKLGQNRSAEDRLGAAAGLEAAGTDDARALAAMMRATIASRA
jgi:transcriptional regulator